MMPTNCIPVKFFLFFFKILKVILWGNWPLAAFPYNRCCQELLSYKDIFVFFATENRQLLGELNGIDTLLQCLSVSLFNYAIEDFFHVYAASSKHEGSWKNSRQLFNTQEADEGLHKCWEFFQLLEEYLLGKYLPPEKNNFPRILLKGYFCNFVEGNFQRSISGKKVIFSKIFGYSNFQIGYQNWSNSCRK